MWISGVGWHRLVRRVSRLRSRLRHVRSGRVGENLEQTMRSPDFIRDRARSLRRAMTGPERLLWSLLRRNTLGLHFRRQHPIGPFVLDFYCAGARLAVELDGPVHSERAEADTRRTEWLAGEGVRVLRFPIADIETRPAAVLAAIAAAART